MRLPCVVMDADRWDEAVLCRIVQRQPGHRGKGPRRRDGPGVASLLSLMGLNALLKGLSTPIHLRQLETGRPHNRDQEDVPNLALPTRRGSTNVKENCLISGPCHPFICQDAIRRGSERHTRANSPVTSKVCQSSLLTLSGFNPINAPLQGGQ